MKKIIFFFTGLFILSACQYVPSEQNEADTMNQDFSDMGGHMMDHGNMENGATGQFSSATADLPEAKPSEIVELSDGDVFRMSADIVKQTVGNRVIKRLAYNGQIPGPLLKAPQHAEVTVEFTNNLDVETTIHSHGLRLKNAFDGIPDVTQEPIKPGERFVYTLTFPDAGLYWYHPHIREDYAQELGLYGGFLVEPDNEAYWSSVDREEILLLDDLLLSSQGLVFSEEYTDHALMGRFGDVFLVNNEENFSIQANTGEVIRLFITNVANTRTFNFTIPKARLKLVGGDGGRIEHEKFVKNIILAPSERAVVEVYFPEPGIFEIQHQTPEKTATLGNVIVQGSLEPNAAAPFEALRDNSADFSAFRSGISELLNREPDKHLRLSVDMHGMDHGMMMDHGQSDSIEWEDEMPMMNQMSTSENTAWKLIDDQTGRENMEINWSFQRGDLVKIRIFNDPNSMHPMQHPIHFHGNRFLVLSRDNVRNENFVWKDTALIKSGETVDVLVEMNNPGTWMAHCHIAEHLHSGMGFLFTVQ